MTIAATLLPEFDQEMASTRALLARTPDADAAWKPHPKSTALGELASHIAALASWTTMVFAGTEMDLSPPGGEPYRTPVFESTATLLAQFDAGVGAARAAIAAASDADMLVPWSLKAGGHTLFTLPRVAMLRGFITNHLIHHRGQYSVYLRLRDVPLPSLYGPTADER